MAQMEGTESTRDQQYRQQLQQAQFRARQASEPPAFNRPLRAGEGATKTAAKAPDPNEPKRQYADPSAFGPHYANQKSALAANRFPQNPVNIPSASKNPASQQSTGQDPVQNLKQSQLQASVNQARQKRLDEQENKKKDESAQTQTDTQQKALKKKMKAGMKRGVMFVLNLIASAIGTATVGIGFIASISIYLFSLAWLNLEMIYGTHLAKGKSKYISPLSWDPIPMPIDKNATILQVFIVAANIALGTVVLVFSFMGIMIIYGLTSPIETGVALASSGYGMFLGDIISTLLSTLFGL